MLEFALAGLIIGFFAGWSLAIYGVKNMFDSATPQDWDKWRKRHSNG